MSSSLSRRDLLKSGGALIVSFAVSGALPTRVYAQNGPPPPPLNIDDFLAIHADGTVTIFTSHVDVGTGLNTAYRQTAAEELGIDPESV